MERGKLALVTGGNGFLGRRLVDMLRDRGFRVRIASSTAGSVGPDVVHANLGDHDALARAVEGCDVVFHLAYAFGGSAKDQHRLNIDGTAALAEAARTAKVRRFVYFSSISAYGAQPDGDLDETATARPTETYARLKQEIEQRLLAMNRADGFPTVILQPTIVYGPNGGTWTISPLDQVKGGKVALPDRGNGICNAVYVDDVVEAALLAASSDNAIGETFLISGPRPVTWKEFYGGYERMSGHQSIVPMDDTTLDRALAARYGGSPKMQRYRRGLERVLKKLRIGARDAIRLPNPGLRTLYGSHTIVRIDKSRAHLGFTPAIELDQGMALTAAWARDHGLI